VDCKPGQSAHKNIGMRILLHDLDGVSPTIIWNGTNSPGWEASKMLFWSTSVKRYYRVNANF